jgi:hypothetical protein
VGATGATGAVGATGATGATGPGTAIVSYFYADTQYGAKIDGQQSFHGKMTSGHATLKTTTNAPFHVGDVGKTISVLGAGPTGKALVTKIASYASASHVVLTTTASTNVTNAGFAWMTTDHAAWTNALAAAKAAGGGYATSAKTGITGINAALTSTAEAVLVLPTNTSATQVYMPIGIVGPVVPGTPFTETTRPTSKPTAKGVLVFFANGAGAQASSNSTYPYSATSAIGVSTKGGTRSSYNNIQFVGRNFIVRTPGSSPYNGLNLRWAQQADLDEVYYDTFQGTGATIPQPLCRNAGIILPGTSNGGKSNFGEIGAVGAYNGVVLGEHADGRRIVTAYCVHSVRRSNSVHAVYVGRIESQWCGTHIFYTPITGATNGSLLRVGLLDIENATATRPTWIRTKYYVSDTGNCMRGGVKIHAVNTGVGPDTTPPLVNGAAHFGIETDGWPGWKTATFASIWAGTFRYRKTDVNEVELQIVVHTSSAASGTITTLPAGFRPGITLVVPAVIKTGNGVVSYIAITTAGVVSTPSTIGSSHALCATIKYYAEN